MSHPQLHGVGCATYQIQLYGSAYERPEVEPPYDAGPGGGENPPVPVNDGGTEIDPEDIIYVDGGTYILGPDGGLIPVVVDPEPEEDAGVDEEEEPLPQFFRDGGYPFTDNSVFVARGALQEARTGFAAVKLADDRIVVVGGYGRNGQTLNSIEIFDPETGVSAVAARMPAARGEPGAALRTDGKVVIAGGISSVTGGQMLRTVEIFDPETSNLECPFNQGNCGLNDTGVIPEENTRLAPVVTTVGNNDIVVAMGDIYNDDDEREPTADGIRILGDGSSVGAITVDPSVLPRFLSATVVLDGGAFAVVGGVTATGFARKDILHFDPATNTLSKTASELTEYAVHAAAGVMPNGKIAVAGGYDALGAPNYDHIHLVANLGTSEAEVEKVEFLSGELSVRYGGSLVPISDDELLFFGGIAQRFTDGEEPPAYVNWFQGLVADSVVPLKTADYIEYKSTGDYWKVLETTSLATPRFGHSALALSDSSVVVLGGLAVTPRRICAPGRRTLRPHLRNLQNLRVVHSGFGLRALGRTALRRLVVHWWARRAHRCRYQTGTPLQRGARSIQRRPAAERIRPQGPHRNPIG